MDRYIALTAKLEDVYREREDVLARMNIDDLRNEIRTCGGEITALSQAPVVVQPLQPLKNPGERLACTNWPELTKRPDLTHKRMQPERAQPDIQRKQWVVDFRRPAGW